MRCQPLRRALSVSISKETKLAKKSAMGHVVNELIDLSKQFWQVSFLSQFCLVCLRCLLQNSLLEF